MGEKALWKPGQVVNKNKTIAHYVTDGITSLVIVRCIT